VTLWIHYQNGRRPNRIKAAKVFRIFFNVDVEWDELLVDKRRQTGVRIRLVFEPLAGASSRRGAEIDKQRFIFVLCSSQRLIGVRDPVN